MRAKVLAVLPLMGCLLLTSCGGSSHPAKGTVSPGPSSSSTTSSTTASKSAAPSHPPRATRPANPRDGADPLATKCSTGASSVAAAVVIKMPDGRAYGILRLRTSPTCHTAWGRVEAVKFRNEDLHIDALRPADHKSALFHTLNATAQENVFGHMLAYSASGCVLARAYVKGGPFAQTLCFKG